MKFKYNTIHEDKAKHKGGSPFFTRNTGKGSEPSKVTNNPKIALLTFWYTWLKLQSRQENMVCYDE